MSVAQKHAMRPPGPLLLVLLGVLAMTAVLLVDPLEWFASRQPAAPPIGAAAAVDAGGKVATPATATIPAAPPPERPERREADPLADLAGFRVVLTPDRPVVDAQVLFVRDDLVFGELHTDANGEVARVADGLPATVLIAVAQRPLERREVVLDAGRHEVRLDAGARVSARFVHADGRPAADLEVEIDCDRPPFADDALGPRSLRALRRDCLVRRRTLLRSDAEGALTVTGLATNWSGALAPQGPWRVTATTHGTVQARGRGVRLAEPATDLVATLAPMPVLRGRLLLKDDGSPLAKVPLMALVRSPDGSSGSDATTDADGRFAFELSSARIDSVELRLGLGDRQLPPILAVDGAQVPKDGDLGDIAIDGLRHVQFVLRDADGAPVARGIATAAGLRSSPTGTDGCGELAFVPRAASQLDAEAPGFVPASAPIPPQLAAPIAVTLQRGNQLRVVVRLPDGANRTQFKVSLRGPRPITAAPVASAEEQRRHVSPWAFDAAAMDPAAMESRLCGNPDAHGLVTFRALRAGIELELLIGGISGEMVYHRETIAPLADAEQREITVSLERGMYAFRGRVLDRDGAPLRRATLQLGGQILGFTDAEGAFACWLASPQTGTLLVQHNTCATLRLDAYAVPLDGAPVEFRLAAARPLTIEVVDGNGAPVPQAEVFIRHGGFIANTHRVEGNRHLAWSMPQEPFEIAVFLAGREFKMPHDPALATARLVVPVLGRVAALIDDASTAGRAGQFALVLAPTTGAAWQPATAKRAAAPGLRIEIAAVPPGSYQATLRYVPSDLERAAGGAELQAPPVEVVVLAGRAAEVRLALPARGGG